MFKLINAVVEELLRILNYLLENNKILVLPLVVTTATLVIFAVGDYFHPLIAAAAYLAPVIFVAMAFFRSLKDEEKNSLRSSFDIRKILSEAILRKTNKDEAVISMTYLSAMKRKNLASKGLLSVISFISANVFMFSKSRESAVFCAVSLVGLILITFKEYIVELRIKKGIFGTTRYEAKELIDFLINNSKDIDFHDDQGNPKKIFLSDPGLSRTNDHPFGQGAKTR